MPQEIERKFLVNAEKWEALEKPVGKPIVQAYLHNEKEKTVRVRIKGEKGFLTIKGKTDGISRLEFEYEIPKNEAEQMIRELGDHVIDKTRYEIKFGRHIWEVDVFHGGNDGLLLAEIELNSEEEEFELPEWVTKEVSMDHRYFNAYLVNHPFQNW